jgi:hypothetical protein
VCFVGDSFVAGVGDRLCLGWADRLAADAYADGVPLTAYNLGVRMQTPTDIRGRFLAECGPRLCPGMLLVRSVCGTAIQRAKLSGTIRPTNRGPAARRAQYRSADGHAARCRVGPLLPRHR